MRLKIWTGVALASGVSVILAALMEQALRTLSEVPASAYIAAGLVPVMLAGQLMMTKRRSRR